MSRSKLISLVIPTFNEEKDIISCLTSLKAQTYKNFEVIVVDDGSTDKTVSRVARFKTDNPKIKIYSKKLQHNGPGTARNFGASIAKGKILVFVDADMLLDPIFIEELTKPIFLMNLTGTSTQSEYLANPDNYWAVCWNIGRFNASGVISQEYKRLILPIRVANGKIYRAIVRKRFIEVSGFDQSGLYTDDLSLERKIGEPVFLANNAIIYHKNPSSLIETWKHSAWIGSSFANRKDLRGKLIGLVWFSPPLAVLKGFYIGLRFGYPQFTFFKLVYDSAVWWTIFLYSA